MAPFRPLDGVVGAGTARLVELRVAKVRYFEASVEFGVDPAVET